jgi:hypothetical protein
MPKINTKSNDPSPMTMTATAHCGNHASSVPAVAVTPLVGLGNTIMKKYNINSKIQNIVKHRVIIYILMQW